LGRWREKCLAEHFGLLLRLVDGSSIRFYERRCECRCCVGPVSGPFHQVPQTRLRCGCFFNSLSMGVTEHLLHESAFSVSRLPVGLVVPVLS
jgi:hypothetical protein